MCGIHVHTTKPARAEEVIRICFEKYKCLVRSFAQKYPRAAVNEYLEYTTLTKLKLISGKNVYTMSKQVMRFTFMHKVPRRNVFNYLLLLISIRHAHRCVQSA